MDQSSKKRTVEETENNGCSQRVTSGRQYEGLIESKRSSRKKKKQSPIHDGSDGVTLLSTYPRRYCIPALLVIFLPSTPPPCAFPLSLTFLQNWPHNFFFFLALFCHSFLSLLKILFSVSVLKRFMSIFSRCSL